MELEVLWNLFQYFKWFDYTLLAVVPSICLISGFFCGIWKTPINIQDHLNGGRSIKIFPVTLSLVASFMNGISILGIPTGIYVSTLQFTYTLAGCIVIAVTMHHIYLPVLYKFNNSIYEYLEERFDQRVRYFVTFLFTMEIITWLPVIVNYTAVSLGYVMGVDVRYIFPFIGLVIIIQVTLGGLQAIIWTDAIQAIIAFSVLLILAIKGTYESTGLHNIIRESWENNKELAKLNPVNKSPLIMDGWIYYLQVAAISQCTIQKFASISSLKQTKKTIWGFLLGSFVVAILSYYCSMLFYAGFHQQYSQFLTVEKSKLDFPCLATALLHEYPGLLGIFTGRMLTASLSIFSSGLAAISTVILNDLKKFCRRLTPPQLSLATKIVILTIGVCSTALAYIVAESEEILRITMDLSAVASTPPVAIFIMGLLMPWVNYQGALVGGISSLLIMLWTCFKPRRPNPLFVVSMRNSSIMEESNTGNSFINNTNIFFDLSKSSHFQISYLWHPLFGALVGVIAGVLTSFLTGTTDFKTIDPQLLPPIVRKLIGRHQNSAHSARNEGSLSKPVGYTSMDDIQEPEPWLRVLP